MSAKLRLLFDECVGKPILDAVATYLAASEQKPDLSHVLDFQQQGIFDETWIPRIAAEGWIVITADRGKRGGRSKGEKLPFVCQQFGVTHILLSARVHEKTTFEKVRLLLQVWSEVADLVNAPRG
ncbi:MAG: PIN-like domain-containing protein [Gemmataceae bacterium]